MFPMLNQLKKLADEVGSIDVLLNTAGVLDAYKTLEETDFAECNEFYQRISIRCI